jgi:hypothetical protein
VLAGALQETVELPATAPGTGDEAVQELPIGSGRLRLALTLRCPDGTVGPLMRSVRVKR